MVNKTTFSKLKINIFFLKNLCFLVKAQNNESSEFFKSMIKLDFL